MRPNGKTMILVAATSILGSIGAAVGTGLLLRNRTAPAPAHVEEKKVEKKAPATIHPVGEMVINLADSPDMRYLKISIALGIVEKVEDAEIKAYDPIVKDAIIKTVSRKTFSELRRPNGIDKIKKELMESIKGDIPKMEIAEIYVEGFAMQ